MTAWVAAIAALGIAGAAGAAIVAWTWPANQRLTCSSALGLALLLGPWAVGIVLMAGGAVGSPAGPTTWAISTGSLALAGLGIWRRRAAVRHQQLARHVGPHVLLALALLATTSLALRTHLGWDGTVVWYHKARMLAQSSGWMPADALRDTTRTWTAPDYPLHVPLAEAWLLLAMGEADERVLKLLPAVWCAGILCLVFGAVRDPRGGETSAGGAPAAVALILLVSVPRVLVGEGSLTSGYADGPMAGLLAAALWIAWRSDWGAAAAWQPLLTVLSLALAWTKQEGLVAVAVLALACVTHTARGRAGRFAAPALALGIGWQVWARAAGAPATMAYGWPGLAALADRAVVIPAAYAREALMVGTWGLFWPALVLAAARAAPQAWRAAGVIAVTVGAGAVGLMFSAWPDVAEHARVTAPRQLIQAVPSLIILVFASEFLPGRSISRQTD